MISRIQFDLANPQFKANPYPTYARLREEALYNAQTPEQRTKESWMPAFLNPLTRNMLDLDASDHTRLRAVGQHGQSWTATAIYMIGGAHGHRAQTTERG